MTTTDFFQILPDSFASPEEAKHPKWLQTNVRYKHFKQTHFTAGDEEQFDTYRNRTAAPVREIPPARMDQRFVPRAVFFAKYKDMGPRAVSRTFAYLFFKFKKSIFCQMRSGELTVFLPFSNNMFRNEWHAKVQPARPFATFPDLFRHIAQLDGYGHSFRESSVERDVQKWVANNALIRYEHPLRESDSGAPAMSDMLRTLAKERDLPDLEFFVNRRDALVLRTNGTEPYTHMFGANQPLLSHHYDTYAPILSMCGHADFADIPIPTWADWGRVCAPGKYFTNVNAAIVPPVIPWDQKRDTAVFRGASTGFGLNARTNPRIRIAQLGAERRMQDGTLLLDAGITRWNRRPRKSETSREIDTIDDCGIPPVPPLTLAEQSRFKYIVHVQGHVAAYRLSAELGTGSVILMVESEYRLWFSAWLVPYQHYVPVKRDLSDLYDKISWCRQNDERCREIAARARSFFERFLGRESILDYLQTVLVFCKQWTGEYRYRSQVFERCQRARQRQFIGLSNVPQGLPRGGDIYRFPDYPRTFDRLQGIQWLTHGRVLEGPHNTGYTSRKTAVTTVDFHGETIALKRSENREELEHDAFIGLACVNRLLQYIPNFRYTYEMRDGSLAMEWISGDTMYKYIQSTAFQFREYVFVLLQLSLALHQAQEYSQLVHRDLTPWNVILHRPDRPAKPVYHIGRQRYVRVRTSCIPIVVDFGRSRAIHDGIHYGVLHASRGLDAMSILLTSMQLIIRTRNLSKEDLHAVFVLARFFQHTDIANGWKLATVRELRQFLSSACKYSNLLRMQTPPELSALKLAEFLQSAFSISLEEITRTDSAMRFGTALHFAEYALSDSPEAMDHAGSRVLNMVERAVHPYLHPFESKYRFFELRRIVAQIEKLHPSLSAHCVVTRDHLAALDVPVRDDLFRVRLPAVRCLPPLTMADMEDLDLVSERWEASSSLDPHLTETIIALERLAGWCGLAGTFPESVFDFQMHVTSARTVLLALQDVQRSEQSVVPEHAGS